ncbi:hypothetical protein PSI23_15635 [Xenorhabdus sp. XENO-10]|uniref:Uncharacterized protein n=1 Tax=Xenorhabdus yunnanensis TaxID=3025878 RepID=A0ABT5LI99_9GAMM|nr:hypothetical protein [Xenorhabdus yunnanensis]MDC9590679.1 hypothetical protein [Xenorhabdus yunnanensis]
MLMETILRDVIKKTQSVFIGGSSNKFFFETKKIDKVGEYESPIVHKLINTIEQKEEKISKLRIEEKQIYSQNGSESIPQCYKYFTKNKFKTNLVGNCDELSTYAFHYLIKNYSLKIFNHYKKPDPDPKKIIYITMYETQEPYDHIFINICHMEDKISSEQMKEALLSIQSESWICDPWADIICKGKNYHYKWQSKMIEWFSSNCFVTDKNIREKIANTERYNNLFSPLRPVIYNAIRQDSKFNVLELAFFDQDGSITTLTRDDKIAPYNISEINRPVIKPQGLYNLNRNSSFNSPSSKNLSDITADKLREKARIYRGLAKIALKKDVKLSD